MRNHQQKLSDIDQRFSEMTIGELTELLETAQILNDGYMNLKAECPYFGASGGGVEMSEQFDPPLDKGIEKEVLALREHGIETFESCQGGEGHPVPDPMVRFHGGRSEGFKALAIALQYGLEVSELRRYWSIQDGEPHGPWWEMTFPPRQ